MYRTTYIDSLHLTTKLHVACVPSQHIDTDASSQHAIVKHYRDKIVGSLNERATKRSTQNVHCDLTTLIGTYVTTSRNHRTAIDERSGTDECIVQMHAQSRVRAAARSMTQSLQAMLTNTITRFGFNEYVIADVMYDLLNDRYDALVERILASDHPDIAKYCAIHDLRYYDAALHMMW
jgi:hypothetical protein